MSVPLLVPVPSPAPPFPEQTSSPGPAICAAIMLTAGGVALGVYTGIKTKEQEFKNCNDRIAEVRAIASDTATKLTDSNVDLTGRLYSLETLANTLNDKLTPDFEHSAHLKRLEAQAVERAANEATRRITTGHFSFTPAR